MALVVLIGWVALVSLDDIGPRGTRANSHLSPLRDETFSGVQARRKT